MNGDGGGVLQVSEHIPGPPIKDHGDEIGQDPFFFRPEEDGLNKLQPPQ